MLRLVLRVVKIALAWRRCLRKRTRPARRPNFVVIFPDQWRADCPGLPHPVVAEKPHLDHWQRPGGIGEKDCQHDPQRLEADGERLIPGGLPRRRGCVLRAERKRKCA